jgi:hypothetical protein
MIQMLNSVRDPMELRALVIFLIRIMDDVDSAGKWVKEDDKAFRLISRMLMNKRHEMFKVKDGHLHVVSNPMNN